MRIGPGLRFSFATKAEPLLWIADAVAGAESARVRGEIGTRKPWRTG